MPEMVYRLVTFLCIELQVNDVTERAALVDSLRGAIEKAAGKTATNGIPFDIFVFESPTEAVLAGVRALKGVSRRVKLYRISAEQMRGAAFAKHTLSFFGIFQRDASDKSLVLFPAALPLRLKGGVLDFWISVVFVILIPLCGNSRQLLAWMCDAIRIEGESLVGRSPFPCSPLREVISDLIDDLSGVRGYESVSGNPEVASLRFFSCHRALILKGNKRYETLFRGAEGKYDIILGVRFRFITLQPIENKAFVRHFDGDLRIGDFKYRFYRNMHNNELERFVVGRGVALSTGTPISVESRDDSNNEIQIDFIEFIPEKSLAARPFGVERSSRLWEFYNVIDYDDRNFHFFAYRIPLSYFLTIFVSYLVFGRTLGNILTGCYVVGSKGTSVHVGQYFLRTIALLFLPLWGVFYLRENRILSDIVSGSKVVVRRSSTGYS